MFAFFFSLFSRSPNKGKIPTRGLPRGTRLHGAPLSASAISAHGVNR